MVYAIMSDIHANASALKKTMDDAWRQGATHIVCLGDIVGYGPEPARSVAMLRVEKATVIAGNHDDAVSGRADAANFSDFAADAVSRHREELRDDEKDWLGALPYIANLDGGAVCAHGDLTAPSEFRYIETTDDAAANFRVCANPVIFVGHTHEPALFVTGASGKTYKTKPQDFALESGKRYIVNVGTVGYPRETNGVCLSSYVIYDSESREVRFRFLPFSVASVMQRGKKTAPHAPAPDGAATAPAKDETAKRERRIVAAAAAAFIAICVVAVLFAVRPRAADTPKNAAPDVRKVESSNVERRDLSKSVKKELVVSGSGKREVRANVVLSKRASAVLTIEFLNQAGAVLSARNIHFKTKNTEKHSVPRGTHRVIFYVAPENSGDTLAISRFAPSEE